MTVIRINAITVPEAAGDELARRFAARAGAVDDQDGFEGFELLRPTDSRTQWLVITRWRDEDAFQAWVASPAFAHGHAGTSERSPHGGPVAASSELWSYEVAGGAPGRPARAGPDLHMLNLVVAAMDASLAFYRMAGVTVPDGDEATGEHVELRMPGGFSLELDTADSARHWHAGFRADPTSVGVVLGFALPSRDAVDDVYAALTGAGYVGRQPPFDAFWGARYAIVADPDGHDVGLMSPIDELRTGEPAESPSP